MARAIAVQKLGLWQRGEVLRHLLRLGDEDRRLRFGQPLRDSAVERYVGGLDFARDRVFGIHLQGTELCAVAHLALDGAAGRAELGLSVDEGLRRRGYGEALLARSVLHAANRGLRVLYMHCLSENSAMMRLAARAGLKIVVAAGEADGRLALQAAPGDALREAMEDQFALVDYVLKQQSALFGRRAPAPRPAAALAAGAPN